MMTGWMPLCALVGQAVLVLAVLGSIVLSRHLQPGGPDQAAGADEVLRRRRTAASIDRDGHLLAQRDLSGS